jgi:hypothetical protein
LYWNGKMLVFTWHFKKEYEALGKPLEFVLEILQHGKHHLVSKRQNKYNVLFSYQTRHLCLSYVEHEQIILIHLKPIRK